MQIDESFPPTAKQEDEITLVLHKAYGIIVDAVASGYIINLPIALFQLTAGGGVIFF